MITQKLCIMPSNTIMAAENTMNEYLSSLPAHPQFLNFRANIGISAINSQLLMHIINTIGKSIDSASAAAYISNMNSTEILSDSEAQLITAATSDYALAPAEKSQRDVLRASILKRCLLVIQ